MITLDQHISYFGQTEDCTRSGGPPPSYPPVVNPEEFISNLQPCNEQDSRLSFLFGPSKFCTDKFNNTKYRIKTKFWDQHYFLGRSIGISTKHQRKRLGIWWTISTWEIRLGINRVYFEYKIPTISLRNTPRELYYYNNNVYNSLGVPISNQPINFPFKTDVAMQVDLTRFGLGSHEITPDNVFELAQKTLLPTAKDYFRSRYSTDLKGLTIFGLTDRKIVYLYINESRRKLDTKLLRQIFHFQFEIGVRFGTNGSFWFLF